MINNSGSLQSVSRDLDMQLALFHSAQSVIDAKNVSNIDASVGALSPA